MFKRFSIALFFSAFAHTAAFADTPVYTADTFANGWDGTVKWANGKTEAISVLLAGDTDGGGPPLLLNFKIEGNDCIGAALEKVRVNRGRVITFQPINSATCILPVSALQLVATTQKEIGVLLVSGLELSGQGTLNPRDPTLQLTLPKPKNYDYAVAATAAVSRPGSLAGYFAVTPFGSVYEFTRAKYGLFYKVIAVSQFQEDAGMHPGQIYAKGRYASKYSTLTLAERVYFTPESKAKYAHCPPMYMTASNFDLVDAKQDETVKTSSPILAMKPRSNRYCTRIGTNNNKCKVIKCMEYSNYDEKQTLIMKDGALARKLGQAARASFQDGGSYAKALARLRQSEANRPKNGGSEPSKGYFDRGGACGNLSCEEEDTLQFLVDQYW